MKKLTLLTASINLRLETSAKNTTSTIEKDTPIQPLVVADRVVRDWMSAVDAIYPDVVEQLGKKEYEIAEYLADNANRIYASNLNFRERLQASGNKGRDALRAFMFHWMTAQVIKSFPVVKLAKIPRSVTGLAP